MARHVGFVSPGHPSRRRAQRLGVRRVHEDGPQQLENGRLLHRDFWCHLQQKKKAAEKRKQHMSLPAATPQEIRSRLLGALGESPPVAEPGGRWGHSFSSHEVPWGVAVLTVVLIALLHLVRLWTAIVDRRYGADHVARELLIALLGCTGLGLFWSDLQRGRVYDGMLKLVGFVGVANVLLPCMWLTYPVRVAPDHDDDLTLLEEDE